MKGKDDLKGRTKKGTAGQFFENSQIPPQAVKHLARRAQIPLIINN